MDSSDLLHKIETRIITIYSDKITQDQLSTILSEIKHNKLSDAQISHKWDETDVVLITYGDTIKRDGEYPLETLHEFINTYLKHAVSCVHILPFFPYSSDEGFSVIDYTKVNPTLGDWIHIEDINEVYDLMIDLVINHISQKSEWFQQFIEDKEPGRNYFIEVSPSADLSAVVRPRTNPLLKEVNTAAGTKYVWTTFSEDQIDLDFSNPDVFIEILRIFLLYLQKGARIIRLDAIAFLWKKIGTSCLHLPETHEMVKLLRDIAEYVNPASIILTETNVPNKENLSYFGNFDEAHIVYQFSLPPLLLHALYSGNSKYLNQWAESMPDLPDGATFFNFTASHDGIGVRPLEGILPEKERDDMMEAMKKAGGYVSYKTNADGTHSPYEINITYWDATKITENGIDKLQIERFICSQTIMMALRGIPAFYIHSFLATPNYHEGVKKTGEYRAINRKKWRWKTLTSALNRVNSTSQIVQESLNRRLIIRKANEAFHPDAKQTILPIHNHLFVIKRFSTNQTIISASNINSQVFETSLPTLTNHEYPSSRWKNLLNQEEFSGDAYITLAPYETVWLTPISE